MTVCSFQAGCQPVFTGFQALCLHTPFPCMSSAACAYASASEFCHSRCCGSFQPPFEKDAGRAEAMDERFVVRRWTERCPVAPVVLLGGDGPKGRKLEAIIGWCYFLMSLQLSGHPLPTYINLIFPRWPPYPPPYPMLNERALMMKSRILIDVNFGFWGTGSDKSLAPSARW